MNNSLGFVLLDAIVGLGLALALASIFLDEQRSLLRSIQLQRQDTNFQSETKNLEALARTTAITQLRQSGDTFTLDRTPARYSCHYVASFPSERFQFSIQRCQSSDLRTTFSLVEPLSPPLQP